MKVNAISTNSFKGLFTNKSKENGGNWRMEYSPYCWESNNTSKMAPKQRFSSFDSVLPDNEEIFEQNPYTRRESSKDILGTESYYKTLDGTMRRTITEVPAMNREDSLKVLNDKLDVFLTHKKYTECSLLNSFAPSQRAFNEASKDYDYWAAEYGLGYFNRNISMKRSDIAPIMNQKKTAMAQEAAKMYSNASELSKLIKSTDVVKNTIENNSLKIKQIAELRKSGRLIDISRRDIVNPNEALVGALQNMKEVANKFVCLPHELISMESILKTLGKDVSSSEIINYIEKIIKRRAI